MARQPAPVTDLGPARRTGPPPAQAGVSARACDLPTLGAFALYLTLSVFFFGRWLFGHFSSLHIGIGPDPKQMIWFLTWWPHALANGIDPLLTHAIWAPLGYNLAWQTCIPLASVIASPLTLIFGPIATFNVLSLLSLPLNASGAFILCRYLTRHYWASLLGGYVFGFSAFMLGHLTFGHLNLILVFPVPMVVYLVARRLAAEMAERVFISLLTLLLVMQFLLFLEIFATMTLLGASSLSLGWLLGTTSARKRINSLIKPVVYSYGLALILVSPYLYYFLHLDFVRTSFWPPSTFSTDLLNFVVPTQTSEFGRIPFLKPLAGTFLQTVADNGSCLSFPLIAITVLYARGHWRAPMVKFLTYCLILIAIFSLGPVLHIAGRAFPIFLPWWPLAHLPVLNQILPMRLSMYAFLVLALIASFWLAADKTNPLLKIAMAAAIIVSNVPNLSAAFWVKPTDSPTFFRNGLYRQYLQRGATVLVLPYADNGDGGFWQAEASMYFNIAEGAGGAWPIDFLRWPIVQAFKVQSYVPDASIQLKAFLAAHAVNAVIVADGDLPEWQPLLSTLDVVPTRVGGVSLYRLNDSRAKDAHQILLDVRTRFDNDRMAMLVRFASNYLANGGEIKSLNVLKFGYLLPKDSLVGPDTVFDPFNPPRLKPISDPRFAYMVWLSTWAGDRVAAGEHVWYPAAAPMIEKLRGIGGEIYYPFPDKYSGTAQSHPDDYGFLLVILTREQLARAAELLKAPAATAIQQTSRRDGSPAPATRRRTLIGRARALGPRSSVALAPLRYGAGPFASPALRRALLRDTARPN